MLLFTQHAPLEGKCHVQRIDHRPPGSAIAKNFNMLVETCTCDKIVQGEIEPQTTGEATRGGKARTGHREVIVGQQL